MKAFDQLDLAGMIKVVRGDARDCLQMRPGTAGRPPREMLGVQIGHNRQERPVSFFE